MLYMKRHAHKGAHRVLETRECKFDHMKGVANHLLRVALGRKAISADSDSEKKKMKMYYGALIALEEATVSENIALDCATNYLAMMAEASVKR
jgi:hypothetical protein